MKKHSYTLTLVILPMTITMLNPIPVKASTIYMNPIDSYIYSMKYDNRDILTQDGEKITSILPKQSNMKNGKFTVIKREKKSIRKKNVDISVINSNNSNIYAGALLKADKNLVDNNPTMISIPRGRLTLSIDLPGMSNGDSKVTIETPTMSNVREGINNILSKWNGDYSPLYPNIPAKLEYSECLAYSMSQLKAKFGNSFEKLITPLNLNFDVVQSGEKQVMIVNFKQIYYTVSVDAPNYPHELFDENISPEDLIKRGVTKKSPPVYVSNVDYGRSIFVKLETNSNNIKFKDAINAYIKGININNNTEYKRILKNTSFTAIVLGGSAESASSVVSGNLDELKKIIKEGASYNKSNPGVPISYTTRFVKDTSIATISSYSEYIQTTSTSYNDSLLKLDHSGAYVARFYINWDELSYDKNGEEIWNHKEWNKNGHPLTAHWSETIQIPANARNLHIVAQKCTGLAWQWWETVYDRRNVPLVKQRDITIWGTTLHHRVCNEVLE